LAPDMLEHQSKALKTRMVDCFFKKQIWAKNGSLGWRPGPGKLGQKGENISLL